MQNVSDRVSNLLSGNVEYSPFLAAGRLLAFAVVVAGDGLAIDKTFDWPTPSLRTFCMCLCVFTRPPGEVEHWPLLHNNAGWHSLPSP